MPDPHRDNSVNDVSNIGLFVAGAHIVTFETRSLDALNPCLTDSYLPTTLSPGSTHMILRYIWALGYEPMAKEMKPLYYLYIG